MIMNSTNVQNSTKPAIAVDTVLGTGLSRQIMEATGRFQFVKEDPEMSMMTFWDNCWEKEYSIKTDWTLEELMQWITNFYAEDYEWRGELKAQRKMRSALGFKAKDVDLIHYDAPAELYEAMEFLSRLHPDRIREITQFIKHQNQ